MSKETKHTQVLDILTKLTKNNKPVSLEPEHKQLKTVIDTGCGPVTADGPNVGNPALPNPVQNTPQPSSIKSR